MGKAARKLIVVADDYGIGPEVSRGILELMQQGVVTGTVLLVNSLGVEEDIRKWNEAGRPGQMGWHPNLTMDKPVADPDQVPSLLDTNGNLASLGKILLRIGSGQLAYAQLVREFDAQYCRYLDLVGEPPALVNGHKHIHVFPMIGQALREVLQRHRVSPYIRRVTEPVRTLRKIPGARLKRLFLNTFGTLAARRQQQSGFPGNDYLAGITDPKWVEDPRFFCRWIEKTPGRIVELMVHPGHHDDSLVGRDCEPNDGNLSRRVNEFHLISQPSFVDSVRTAGFTLCQASRA